MGLLALRPSNLLTILKDGFIDRLQKIGFPPSCYPSYGASDFYPDGSVSH
jgi:hypothetical protein